MLKIVRNKLLTGSIKRVVVFGSEMPKSAPYVVIKPEALPFGTGLRIIVHYPRNYQTQLRSYIFDEVSDLLNGFVYTDESGTSNEVLDGEEYGDIVAVNDDNTISMERLFYVPSMLY